MPDAKQNQRSQQSIDNPAGKPKHKSPAGKDEAAGLGSSQGQDTESSRDTVPHTAPGTADIERASAGAQGHSDSLADDPVGAFKERP